MAVENILTVDLEDWFHICGVDNLIPKESWPGLESRIDRNTSRILEILSRKSVKATFFVLGYIAERHPELIEKIKNAGHEIATHGYAHDRVYKMTPEGFRKDIKKSAKIISAITGLPVKGYRAPEWSIRDDSLWALYILKQEGFEYDSSMAPLPFIGNKNYPRIPYRLDLGEKGLWEFPPLVGTCFPVNLPFGGGWGLRVFPYSLIRSSIRRLNKQGRPGIIFLHPREFDMNCPSIRLPLIKRFVLDAQIESTEKRLNRLLDDFEFSSISIVLEKLRKIAYTRPSIYNSRAN